jgi:hypothetical protein
MAYYPESTSSTSYTREYFNQYYKYISKPKIDINKLIKTKGRKEVTIDELIEEENSFMFDIKNLVI